MSYLVSMLKTKVEPLSIVKPVGRPPVKNKAKRPKDQSKNTARQNAALAKYKAAMSLEWNKTTDMAAALKRPPSNILGTLNKWLSLNLVERRIVGNWPSPKTEGYEWKMK